MGDEDEDDDDKSESSSMSTTTGAGAPSSSEGSGGKGVGILVLLLLLGLVSAAAAVYVLTGVPNGDGEPKNDTGNASGPVGVAPPAAGPAVTGESVVVASQQEPDMVPDPKATPTAAAATMSTKTMSTNATSTSATSTNTMSANTTSTGATSTTAMAGPTATTTATMAGTSTKFMLAKARRGPGDHVRHAGGHSRTGTSRSKTRKKQVAQVQSRRSSATETTGKVKGADAEAVYNGSSFRALPRPNASAGTNTKSTVGVTSHYTPDSRLASLQTKSAKTSIRKAITRKNHP